MAIRPPLMSHGQANDFYAYMTVGTGLMWLAGGVAAGPAAIALGLCGAGAVANNYDPASGNNPRMKLDLSSATPPEPLSYPSWPDEAYQVIAEMEANLERNYGQNAVYCFRTMAHEGYTVADAYSTLDSLLASLKAQGYWNKGKIQSGNQSPKELLDGLFGRRVASPELQQYLGDEYFQKLITDILQTSHEKGQPEGFRDSYLLDMSMIVYVLGLSPVTDKPVRRIKWWTSRRPEMPVFYACDWKWFYAMPYRDFRDRFETVIGFGFENGMPRHLGEEAEDLFHYRVEEYSSTAPPGHPGDVSWSRIIFGRDKPFPASEEDMRGMP